MIDRISTRVLENGALRYGIYDENGNLLRYEYIRPEDEPLNEGTPINKATSLSDNTANKVWRGFPPENPTVSMSLGQLADDVLVKDFSTFERIQRGLY